MPQFAVKEMERMATETQQLPTMLLQKPPSGLRFNMTKDGWVAEDVDAIVGEPTLCLDEVLREGESYVKGDVMLERAREMGDLAGQLHAMRLRDQHYRIPVEWRGKILVFAGTVRPGPIVGLSVACLGWLGGRWCFYFRWIGDGFNDYHRVVRLRPDTKA